MEQFKLFKQTNWQQPVAKRDHERFGKSRNLGTSNWYISDQGRVKVEYVDQDGDIKKTRFPKIHTKGGHPTKRYACLSTQEYIHRLVATAFIPNPEHKRTVNHKDMNPLNNDVNNLEWSTHKENSQHAAQTRRRNKNNK